MTGFEIELCLGILIIFIKNYLLSQNGLCAVNCEMRRVRSRDIDNSVEIHTLLWELDLSECSNEPRIHLSFAAAFLRGHKLTIKSNHMHIHFNHFGGSTLSHRIISSIRVRAFMRVCFCVRITNPKMCAELLCAIDILFHLYVPLTSFA